MEYRLPGKEAKLHKAPRSLYCGVPPFFFLLAGGLAFYPSPRLLLAWGAQGCHFQPADLDVKIKESATTFTSYTAFRGRDSCGGPAHLDLLQTILLICRVVTAIGIEIEIRLCGASLQGNRFDMVGSSCHFPTFLTPYSPYPL